MIIQLPGHVLRASPDRTHDQTEHGQDRVEEEASRGVAAASWQAIQGRCHHQSSDQARSRAWVRSASAKRQLSTRRRVFSASIAWVWAWTVVPSAISLRSRPQRGQFTAGIEHGVAVALLIGRIADQLATIVAAAGRGYDPERFSGRLMQAERRVPPIVVWHGCPSSFRLSVQPQAGCGLRQGRQLLIVTDLRVTLQYVAGELVLTQRRFQLRRQPPGLAADFLGQAQAGQKTQPLEFLQPSGLAKRIGRDPTVRRSPPAQHPPGAAGCDQSS